MKAIIGGDMFKKLFFPAFFLFFLSACGGGGTSVSVESGGSSGSSEKVETYLAYASSIEFVDCNSPGSPVEVVQGKVDDVRVFRRALKVDFSKGTYEGFHYNYLAFIRDGKVFRLSLLKGKELPLPREVKGISDGCSFVEGEGELGSDRGFVVVETAGSDGDCSGRDDNGESLVDLSGMRVQELGSKRIVLFLPDSGYRVEKALFFDLSGNLPLICSLSDVAECSQVQVSGNVFKADFRAGVSVYRYEKKGFEHFYCIDFGPGAAIYRWNGEELVALPGAPCPGWFTMAADEEFIYGTDGRGVFRYRNGVMQELLSSSDLSVDSITGISVLRAGLIVHTVKNLVEKALFYYEFKSGKVTLIDRPVVEGMVYTGLARDRAFYVKLSDNNTLAACLWKDSGDKVCTEGSYWAGYSYLPSGGLNSMAGSVLLYDFSRDVLELTDLDGNVIRVLGAPHLGTEATVSFFGIGSCLLGQMLGKDGNMDIFFVNLDKENSLVRLTDTPDRKEMAIF